MTPNAKKFKFGEWLPDLPDLDNPGVTVAQNVLPAGPAAAGYQPYLPLATVRTAFSETLTAAFHALFGFAANGAIVLYVGTPHGHLYQSGTPFGTTWTDFAPGPLNTINQLIQFQNYVVATDNLNNPLYQIVGGGSNFATVGTAGVNMPICRCVGSVGQFLFAGNLDGGGGAGGNYVQWSGINQPLLWPVIGSAAAIAAQSGQQGLHQEFGNVTGVYGADQWGVAFQQGAITRLNYIGGTAVFQFDTLSAGVGMDMQNGAIRIANMVYFASSKGFYATDGVNLNPIGEDKINRWFIANYVSNINSASCAADWTNKLIYWSFRMNGGATTLLVAYNFERNRFAYALDSNLSCMVAADDIAFNTLSLGNFGICGIGIDKKFGQFNGTPGTATITSAEIELNPGGKALVQGFRPQITGSTSVTCKVGSRMRQSDSVTFSSALTPNPQTGFADCLIEAGYHRVETDITGAFTQALGGEFLADPAGAF